MSHSSYVDLGPLPTLQKYLARVDAEVKSFRRYAIKVQDGNGYWKETASISVKSDGTLKLWGEVAEPTKEEAAAIKLEVENANWPKPKPGPKRALPDALKDADPDSLFPFLTPDGEHILFLQQRIDRRDGKQYLPWSYWSDDQWRNIEPDGLLPLFGLDKIDGHTTVFIHEGAKAARHCQWLKAKETRAAAAALAAHPLGNEIGAVAHLGWAGGAPNPHRTDWSILKRAGITRVYVIADNDHPGQQAVKEISRLTQMRMTAVLFDDHFKHSFDLADEWPNAEAQPDWWRGDRYIGPGLHDLSSPATWATKKVETGKPGKPAFELREEFVRQWALSKEPHLIANREYTHILVTPEVFNRTVAPYADADDVAKLLAKYVPPHADGITYTPHPAKKRERIITKDGRRLINTYRPPTIQPVAGNVMPFLRFMTRLFPTKRDRFLVLRWCATLIARPQIRMRYSMILISQRQGVGKTTLSDAILKPLVGPWNVSMPNEQQITDGAFNSWRAHKRLVIVNEIYSGERRRAYDRLKDVVSDDEFDVNRKFLEPYTIESYTHVVACSNSMKAIHLDDEDRRWLVPDVTEELTPKEDWIALYAWLKSGGLSNIAAWAERFVVKHGPVATGDRAPETARKREVIAGLRSPGSTLAYDLGLMVMEALTLNQDEAKRRAALEGRDKAIPTGKIILRIDDVQNWVAKMRNMEGTHPKLETMLMLRNALKSAGLMELQRADGKDQRVYIKGAPVYVMANFLIEGRQPWGNKEKPGLCQYRCDPNDFIPVPM